MCSFISDKWEGKCKGKGAVVSCLCQNFLAAMLSFI